MGILDAINPEDRIQITKSEYYGLMRNTAQLEMMIRLIENNVDISIIKKAFCIPEEV